MNEPLCQMIYRDILKIEEDLPQLLLPPSVHQFRLNSFQIKRRFRQWYQHLKIKYLIMTFITPSNDLPSWQL